MTSPPCWSIGTGKRNSYIRNDSGQLPGPGAYDLTNLRKSTAPRYSIGNSSRREETKNDSPGPGTYNSPGKISRKHPSYHIASKTEPNDRDRSPTPGPGSYDTSRLLRGTDRKAPSFSIPSRHSARELRTDSPGPAAYEQSSTIRLRRAPTYRMGTSQRDRLYTSQDIPGPASYVSQSLNLKNGPKWAFGTSERSETESTARMVPGPGTYSLSGIFERKGKGAVIVSRRPDSALVDSAKIPGPGAYDPSMNVKLKAPTVRIGSAPRTGMERESTAFVPSPGNYDTFRASRHGTGVIFGRSKRRPLNDPTCTLGPAAYDLNISTNDGPRHVIVPKREDVTKDQKDRSTPGPSDYHPSVYYVKNNAGYVRIGTSRRDQLYGSDMAPGPGAYDVRNNKRGPKWGFGTEKRSKSLSRSVEPGPGAYNIPPKFANVPKYALSRS